MPVASPSELAFWAVANVAIFKIASLIVGLLFGYMGYRLFIGGFVRPAGDLEASSGSKMIKLNRAAPGTFFALFGAVIIAATVFKGFEVELPSAASSAFGLPEHPPMVTNE